MDGRLRKSRLKKPRTWWSGTHQETEDRGLMSWGHLELHSDTISKQQQKNQKCKQATSPASGSMVSQSVEVDMSCLRSGLTIVSNNIHFKIGKRKTFE